MIDRGGRDVMLSHHAAVRTVGRCCSLGRQNGKSRFAARGFIFLPPILLTGEDAGRMGKGVAA